MVESRRIGAVLTGDIVGRSRSAGRDVERALAVSFEALEQAFAAFPDGLHVDREGRWEIECMRPQVALRAALYYRAELRARLGTPTVDTRVAIGVGPLGADTESEGRRGGAAARRALTALEELPRTRRLVLRLEDRPLGPGFDEMIHLVDHLAGRWTDKQALAVTGALLGCTQDAIAGRWGRLEPQAAGAGRQVSQQTVAQHLQRAGWSALGPALAFLEGLLI